MQVKLIKIIEEIKALSVPEDIFFLQREIKRITNCRDEIKIKLRVLNIELQQFDIRTLSKNDELLFTELTAHLIELIKEIYMCTPTYYGSHNELYGGSISGFRRGVNDGLHPWLQISLEFLKNIALCIDDESSENTLLPKVMELNKLLHGYNHSLIAEARFKPAISSGVKSIPCRASTIRPSFATVGISKESTNIHNIKAKKGLNPEAKEFVPQFFLKA